MKLKNPKAVRLTKQGVRDLNPAGYNGRRSVEDDYCPHFFGATQIIGERWNGRYEVPVYGRKCLHCGETRESW